MRIIRSLLITASFLALTISQASQQQMFLSVAAQATGTVPVTANLVAQWIGDNYTAGSWLDSSGSGNTATQATAGKQPTLVASSLNGHSIVRFTAASTQYLTLTTAFYPGTNWTQFAVIKKAASGNSVQVMTNLTGGDPVSLQCYTDNKIYTENQANLWSLSDAATSWAYWVTENTSNTITLRKSAAAQTLTNLGANVSANQWNTIGARSDVSSYSNGDFAEILIYSTALNPTDRALVEAYLATKYGL